MSRFDAALALMSLGFIPDTDFVCTQVAANTTEITWLSAQPQPSEATLNAVTQAQIDAWFTTQLREPVLAYADELKKTDLTRLVIGVITLTLNEFNSHALKINAILDAIDAGTSLATVKSNIAAITDYPQRTKSDLINALKNIINDGQVD